jgi:hypothetical protein
MMFARRQELLFSLVLGKAMVGYLGDSGLGCEAARYKYYTHHHLLTQSFCISCGVGVVSKNIWYLIVTAGRVILAERDFDLGRAGESSVVLISQKRVYIS